MRVKMLSPEGIELSLDGVYNWDQEWEAAHRFYGEVFAGDEVPSAEKVGARGMGVFLLFSSISSVLCLSLVGGVGRG